MLPVLYTIHFNQRNYTTYVDKYVPPQDGHWMVDIYWRCDSGFNQQRHIQRLCLRVCLCVKQERQCKYSVKVRRVHITNVAVEKQ
jgi:hypothetical protein